MTTVTTHDHADNRHADDRLFAADAIIAGMNAAAAVGGLMVLGVIWFVHVAGLLTANAHILATVVALVVLVFVGSLVLYANAFSPQSMATRRRYEVKQAAASHPLRQIRFVDWIGGVLNRAGRLRTAHVILFVTGLLDDGASLRAAVIFFAAAVLVVPAVLVGGFGSPHDTLLVGSVIMAQALIIRSEVVRCGQRLLAAGAAA